MRRRFTWLALCCAAIGVTAIYHVAKLHATPAVGFVGTTLALGRFGPIDMSNVYVPPDYPEKHKNGIWLSLLKTKGASDVYVQSNVWEAGGSTGWHTHPGGSLIIVTAGTVTAYEGNDPQLQAACIRNRRRLRRSRRRPRPSAPQRGHRRSANHRRPTHPGRHNTPHRRRRSRALPLLVCF